MALLRPLIIGFATTLKHLSKKPITVNYPEQKVPMFPKFRGKQVLMRDENGLEKCVACGSCSVACPADAIYLEAAENDGSVQAGPRYASTFQIHKTRCIFCGYCEEACPVGAIFMGKDYELAVYSKDDFVWDKTDMLVPADDRRLPDMQIGALGDIHGAFDIVQQIMARHPEVPLWVQVGDIASNDGDYFTPTAPLYWIKGNNEDFDVIAAAMNGHPPAANLHYLRNGVPHVVGPWRVAALGGTFAPSWYHSPVSSLPPSRGQRMSGAAVKLGKSRDDKRRHFVREEVLACKNIMDVDVFLTHEAPRPFYPAGKRIDTGKTVINEVLASMRPRLHLFGHHHEFTDSVRQSVRSIGLDLVTRSYLLIDAGTLRCERLDT